MNRTELRRLYLVTGLDPPPRHLPTSALKRMDTFLALSDQGRRRRLVERFVQANWKTLSETLTCAGDCAQATNTCSDAQALACYLINKTSVDP